MPTPQNSKKFLTLAQTIQKATNGQRRAFYVLIYNALGQTQSDVILLPVSTAGSYRVWKLGSPENEAKVVPSMPASKPTCEKSSPYVLPLNTGNLPEVGASVFQVRLLEQDRSKNDHISSLHVDARSLELRAAIDTKGNVEFSNGQIRVVFDG